MKYEICKKSTTDSKVWYAVAWSDTFEWAKKIADSLNCTGNGEFAVFKEGKMI